MFMLEQELNPQPENTPPSKPEIMLSPVMKVTDLAELLHQPVTEVIRYLLKNGVLVTLNDNLDFETAAIVADDFGYKAVLGEE
ncbi:MAG: Translation initiation factor IF-2 [candidate division Kazan bacterium GW2011_GWB1_45_10]|uniref:Translation initiation factor IF-2 n=1 Tax=candidate division Kazan bacterium GW2011_GWB1_45_10 TaxID=1620411 RepID=A0A0G1KT06_UNCK3|nr:MAG: Translation initiation factor IF-2 [candidate division Kazan bacterium GW2011_GWB1_45_10]